jgi:hypothetical protein
VSFHTVGSRIILTDSTNDAAQLKKEKYEKLLDEHYTRAKSTVFSGWYDSEIRDYLVKHGYLKSDAQAKRDEVSILLTEKEISLTCSSSTLSLPSTRSLPPPLTSPGPMRDSELSLGLTALTTPSSRADPLWSTRSESDTSSPRTRSSRSSLPSETPSPPVSNSPRTSSPPF